MFGKLYPKNQNHLKSNNSKQNTYISKEHFLDEKTF